MLKEFKKPGLEIQGGGRGFHDMLAWRRKEGSSTLHKRKRKKWPGFSKRRSKEVTWSQGGEGKASKAEKSWLSKKTGRRKGRSTILLLETG